MASVVIAEDHRMVRQALRRVLEAKGIRVLAECDDGLTVVDEVRQCKPDILILDLALPGLHGLDVLERVTRRCPKTRVLVLSGDGRDDFVLGAVRRGASGYVLKGGDLSELITAVETLGRGGRYVSSALSQSLMDAVAEPTPSRLADPYDTLTDREREVFVLIAGGLSNTGIAQRLSISPRTAETHRANIMRKLNLRTPTEAVLLAVQRGIVARH